MWLAGEGLEGLPVPMPELPDESGAFPARASWAGFRLREPQQRARQEITYRRRRAQALLDQCAAVEKVEHGRPAGVGQRSSRPV